MASHYPPGMIGVPCQRSGQDSDLLPSIMQMQKPDGTMFQKTVGLGPASPLNEIGKAFMANSHLQWLFLTNDDNLCPSNTIPRLLDHNVAAVTGLYLSRMQPFEPVLYDKVEYVGPELAKMYPNATKSYRWYWRKFLRPGEKGLVPIVACGEGCLMLQRRVLEKIPYPWWEYGETMSDKCDHDVTLSRKIREAKFGLWCDLEIRVDHITSMVVRPTRTEDGEWKTQLLQADRALVLDAAQPPIFDDGFSK